MLRGKKKTLQGLKTSCRREIWDEGPVEQTWLRAGCQREQVAMGAFNSAGVAVAREVRKAWGPCSAQDCRTY